ISMIFTDPTRASTLLLTALMVIGLVFFIRASTKDRIEVMQFGSSQAVEPLQQDVISYFQKRAYRAVTKAVTVSDSKTDNAENTAEAVNSTDTNSSETITVAGMVSPSIFMAVFLSTLAAVGFACLALVVATLFPAWGKLLFGLVTLSPLAGVFYWRKSSRPEEVSFRVESSESSENGLVSKLTVKGHRDELAELKNAFAPVLTAWR
ncbi:MAG: cofactor assembly of complex C subunit B, partial [Cyanobacteria bacterium J06650_10]